MTSYGSGADDLTPIFDVDALLHRAIEIIDTAKSMPLSASVIVGRDEMRGILEACIENLPLEVRQASWMLKERAEFLAKMEREGDEILRAARERAERMVARSELVKEAQRTAQRVMEQASDEARRLHHEAEDYCDQKLAGFEIILQKTLHTVQGGRQKLRGSPFISLQETTEDSELGDRAPRNSEADGAALFDQERRPRR